jgi:hypothetical protein
METFKYVIDIDERRNVVVNLPTTVPVGKAEIVIIIQPLNNGQKRKGEIDLAARGITPEQAADMRNRVISFEEDWNAPGMEVYDEL